MTGCCVHTMPAPRSADMRYARTIIFKQLAHVIVVLFHVCTECVHTMKAE